MKKVCINVNTVELLPLRPPLNYHKFFLELE